MEDREELYDQEKDRFSPEAGETERKRVDDEELLVTPDSSASPPQVETRDESPAHSVQFVDQPVSTAEPDDAADAYQEEAVEGGGPYMPEPDETHKKPSNFFGVEHGLEGSVPEGEEATDSDELIWNKPGSFTTTSVTHAQYRGRDVIGSAGSMLKVPALPPRIIGLDYRTDITADTHTLGKLHVSAASIRGASHFESAEPRQDSYAVGSSRGDEWLILALADGVSAGRFSHLAADTACIYGLSSARELLASLESQNPSPQAIEALEWSKVLDDVRSAILTQARKIVGSAIRDLDGNPANPADVPPETYAQAMSTTFEVSVISCLPVEGKHIFARIIFAGDGSALIIDPERGWRILGVGKSDDAHLRSNAVVPLPVHPGPPIMTSGFLEHGQAMVITTDGIGDFLSDGSTAVGGYLHERWSHPLGLTEFINTIGFITEQADDDRTALVVWA